MIVGDTISPWLGDALAFVKALGAAFSAMVGQAAAVQYGRSGVLPGSLSQVGKRSGLPVTALLAAAAVNTVLAVVAASVDNGLSQLVSFVDVGAICGFILLHCSVIGLFLVKRSLRALLACGLVPLLGIAVLAPVLFHIHTPALAAGALWLLVGLVVLWHRRAAF
ncbi:amino acid transporter [Serratia rubidaea]|nr:amino acid transporter [Serratia rubidaea]